LKVDFPDQPEMQVSTETIYQSLYVQSRGALKRDLTRYLRTGRAVRRPSRKVGQRKNRIPNMINIAERPAEAEDRAVHRGGGAHRGAARATCAVTASG
jgi:transposase, IS30 family